MNRAERIEAHPLLTKLLQASCLSRIRRHIFVAMGADDERDDVLQEVLLKSLRGIGHLREAASFDTWILRVTKSTISNFRRRRSRRYPSWEPLSDENGPVFYGSLDARDLASRAIRIIEHLPEAERALLTRYWFSRRTIDSLAAEDHCSRITMRRRLARARVHFERSARRDPALRAAFA